MKMAKISHTKIKQPSFGEKRPKLTYTKISRFTVFYEIKVITAMMVLLLNLHLPMQSVPILAKVGKAHLI